ncbi:MAG: anaerobic sulfatase maturase [Planctomycetota bacterium]|jgi:uncharacterized protein
MRPFSLLVKPAGPDCNLRCEYCFYLKKCELFQEERQHRMTDETLEAMIKGYMATPQPQYSFGWQGGEPTLMGVDFFKRVVELQQRYGRAGASVANGLQTNGTLIDAEFARHLAEYKFLLGVSLDGPPEIHNHYRLNAAGRGSHADVMSGIHHLLHHKVEFNILVLVSQANVHRAKEVYHYLCDQGFLFHQYIPCVEFVAPGEISPFSITGQEWGAFMNEIYDQWLPHDTRRVSIRHFDSVVNYFVTGQRNVCMMGHNCCQYFVVEHNGDIFPCDFYVEKELKLGNVTETDWGEAQKSELYTQFGCQKTQWNDACVSCPCLELCAGDCLKHRLPMTTARDPHSLSHLCEGQKMFIEHTTEGFQRLASEVKAQHEAERRQMAQMQMGPRPAPPQPPTQRVGRNDPCPCGSGRKYKKCCG